MMKTAILVAFLLFGSGAAQAQFDWLRNHMDEKREKLRQEQRAEIERLRARGLCGPTEGLYQCEHRIKKEAARKDELAACQKKLREIKDSCAAAGHIFDCIAIRGEPHGIRYDDTFNFSGRPDIKYFTCP